MPARPRSPTPDFFRDAINARGLMMPMVRVRPTSKMNYIGWIQRAKLESTRQKHLNQMLDELKKGNVYMKVKWSPK